MAKGTVISALDYYTNLQKSDASTRWTGDAGSETNPYCIEDFYDLKSSENNKHYLLVKDINMNDYDDYKYDFSQIQIIACTINGLDPYTNVKHEIRNILSINNINTVQSGLFNLDLYDYVSTLRIVTIKNIRFNNFIRSNSNCSLFSSGTNYPSVNILNCEFTVYNIFNNSNKNYINSWLTSIRSCSDNDINYAFNHYTYTNCIFNMKGMFWYNSNNSNYASAVITGAKFRYCHFNIMPSDGVYIMFKCDLISCYLTGSFTLAKAEYGGYLFDGNGEDTNESYSNSYVNIEIKNPNNYGTNGFNRYSITYKGSKGSDTGVFKTVCFLNYDKFKTGFYYERTYNNFYALYDDACKNQSTLEGFGFLTVAGE